MRLGCTCDGINNNVQNNKTQICNKKVTVVNNYRSFFVLNSSAYDPRFDSKFTKVILYNCKCRRAS